MFMRLLDDNNLASHLTVAYVELVRQFAPSSAQRSADCPNLGGFFQNGNERRIHKLLFLMRPRQTESFAPNILP